MVTVPAVVALFAMLAPAALVVWLAVTWPAEAAERALWRLGDDAWDSGDHAAAQRCRRIAPSFGVCRDQVRLYDLSALIAFRSLRARAVAVEPTQLDRRLAAIWCRATPGLMLWSVCVAAGCVLRDPSLLGSPARCAAAVMDRVTAVFCAHDATVAPHHDTLTATLEGPHRPR